MHWWSYKLLMLIINGSIWFIILYYIIAHNIIGVGMIRLFLRIRKQYFQSPDTFLFLPQPGYFDGLGGLKPLKIVMGQVYASIVASGFCLLLGFYYMPAGSAAILTPLLILFFLANPFFVLIPTMQIHQDWRKWKEKTLVELFRIREELFKVASEKVDSTSPILINQDEVAIRLFTVRERYKDVLEMPTSLFSIRRAAVFIIIYALPVMAFICSVLTNL
jgi:hypothetical protein